MQILTKRVKLDESDSEAFIKSKWTETTIEFEVLVRNKNGEEKSSFDSRIWLNNFLC